MYNSVINAHKQLEYITANKFPCCKVYMFGSCVTTGSWDGVGDIDFTVVNEKLFAMNKWPPKDEGEFIMNFCRFLRTVGFSFDELIPICHTRVPVVKRKKEADKYLISPDKFLVKFLFQSKLTPDNRKAIVEKFPNVELKFLADSCVLWFHDGLEAMANFLSPPKGISTKKVKTSWGAKINMPELFGVDFDVSARVHGIRNSRLLREYLGQCHEARAGSVFIKHWSKQCGVNNSLRGFLTSYAVTIMWIYFLIQKDVVKFVDPQSIDFNPEGMNVSYLPLLPVEQDTEEFSEILGKLIAGFFHFYTFDFDWKETVISISRTDVTLKSSLNWTEEHEERTGAFGKRKWYKLCIEDPFEDNLNLGRHISDNKINKVMAEISRGYGIVHSNTPQDLLREATLPDTFVRRLKRVFLMGGNIYNRNQLMEKLRYDDLQGIAKLETEWTTSTLFKEAGLTVSQTGEVQGPNCSYPVDQMILLANSIDNELRSDRNKVIGVPLTYKCDEWEVEVSEVEPVRELYWESAASGRLFRDCRTRSAFEAHLSVVTECSKMEKGFTDEQLSTRIRNKMKHQTNEEIITEILNDSRYVDLRDGLYFPKELKSNTPISKDLSTKTSGKCDGCRRNRNELYRTTNPEKDSGAYCDACWDNW